MLFFVLWVRVTSLTHFNQPNWCSSFTIDEAITWLDCCASWSLNWEGWHPWGKRGFGLAFSSVFVQLIAHASTIAAGQEHQQAVEQEALLGWLFREAVEQEGFIWFNTFLWFNYCLPLVLTCLGSEITWGAEQTEINICFITVNSWFNKYLLAWVVGCLLSAMRWCSCWVQGTSNISVLEMTPCSVAFWSSPSSVAPLSWATAALLYISIHLPGRSLAVHHPPCCCSRNKLTWLSELRW